MKIWFDLTNTPHVVIFNQLIKELSKDHELKITCRDLANTIELLKVHNIPYTPVGYHYGKNPVKKLLGFPIRVAQLVSHLKNEKIDVAIAQANFYLPVACKLLGIRSIYMNDNEHSKGNVIAFRFADVIMVPEYFTDESLRRQGADLRKVIKYPGVKEGIYIWSCFDFSKRRAPEPGARPSVFIRTEPRTAQYYDGPVNFMDTLLKDLRDKVDVYLSPRDKFQLDYYSGPDFAGINVLKKPMDLKDILEKCDLFIGAGGTMTREAAIAGIPTICVYQGKLLDVDNYLIQKGLMVFMKEPKVGDVMDLLKSKSATKPDQELLVKGEETYNMIKNLLLNKAQM